MRIEAWKCPRTGKLFDSILGWEDHLAALRKDDESLAARPALLERLADAQRFPFENAESLKHLGELLSIAYRDVMSLRVELGELPATALEYELLETDTTELILDEIRETVRVQVNVPRGTLVFSGALSFAYKDAGSNAVYPDIYAMFPALGAGCAGSSSGGTAYSRFTEKTDDGKVVVASYVSVLVSHTPHLEALLPEYQRLMRGGIQALFQEKEAALIELRDRDVGHLAAIAGMSSLLRQQQELEQRLSEQRTVIERSKTRLEQAVIASLPKLVAAYKLMDRLGIEPPL